MGKHLVCSCESYVQFSEASATTSPVHEFFRMEQQVLDLLEATLDPSGPIRNDAERHLEQLYTNESFPISLLSIASHKEVRLEHRQSALLYLKKLVVKTWSPSLEEYEGPSVLDDATKDQVRQSVLSIATAGDEERKITGAASYVVSKIASADFPEQWPSLLLHMLALVPQAGETQLHGVLVVLGNLVEDGFDEDQFSGSAIDLVKCIYDVAVNHERKWTTRALAVSIFRACFDTMELVYLNNKASIQQFMQDASDAWTPFFIEVLKTPLPYMPSEDEENKGSPGSQAVINWRGAIALKTQVVKVRRVKPIANRYTNSLARPLTRSTTCSPIFSPREHWNCLVKCGRVSTLTLGHTTVCTAVMNNGRGVWKMQTDCHTHSISL